MVAQEGDVGLGEGDVDGPSVNLIPDERRRESAMNLRQVFQNVSEEEGREGRKWEAVPGSSRP